MPEFILFMHNDVSDRTAADSDAKWEAYIARLETRGCFQGGSSLGRGVRFKKGAPSSPSNQSIEGFIRVVADDLVHAEGHLNGNPNFEAGGTIEILELIPEQ